MEGSSRGSWEGNHRQEKWEPVLDDMENHREYVAEFVERRLAGNDTSCSYLARRERRVCGATSYLHDSWHSLSSPIQSFCVPTALFHPSKRMRAAFVLIVVPPSHAAADVVLEGSGTKDSVCVALAVPFVA